MSDKNNKKKILIADDAHETRNLVRMFLQKEGFDVIEAKNGQEAVDKSLSEMPDLVILDIIMPMLDGISAAVELFKKDKTKNIPVIINTTRGQLKDLLDLKETTQVRDFLEKPFRPAELVEKVRKILK